MARKALIRRSGQQVVNVIAWEPGSDWPVPTGHYLREAADASPGDTWDGAKYVKPVPPEPPAPVEPPIIGIMDAVLKGRGLAGLTDQERDAAQAALG